MNKFDFTTRIFNINRLLVKEYDSLLQQAVKTLDHTDTEEIEKIYNLRKTLDSLKQEHGKLTEQLQILAEEENNGN